MNVHVHVYVHVKDSGFDYLAFNLKTKLITLPCQKCVVVVQRASAKCNVKSACVNVKTNTTTTTTTVCACACAACVYVYRTHTHVSCFSDESLTSVKLKE